MLIDDFLNDGIKTGSFQYTNYSNKFLIVEGIKDLVVLTNENVVLKLKVGEMEVKGNNLQIKELGKNVICIKGKILSVNTSQI